MFNEDGRNVRTELKAALMRRGITQAALAQAVGISEPIMSMLIRGSYWPKRSELFMIARYLDIHPADLFPTESEMMDFRPFDDFCKQLGGSAPMRRTTTPGGDR